MQFLKAPSPRITLSDLFKKEIRVNDEQFSNAYSIILLTELGKVIWVKEEQSENAFFSIIVTLSGMDISVNEQQPKKEK